MNEKNVRDVIVDVDVGTDDYLALLLLFYAEKIGDLKIKAIVCSMGNTSVENVCRNVIRLLETIGRTDIPLYKGVETQILLPKETAKTFHGNDGFGDLQHDKDPDLSIISDTLAATAIQDIICSKPNSISFICLGPLTNLALALKLYNDLGLNIKDVWIMGGNHKAVGNITSAAEYNFYIDPEAAYIVLQTLKCPIFILPWEPCMKPQINFEWRYNVLGDQTPALNLLTRAEKSIYKGNYKFWIPCDAFLCFCFLNPEKHITKQSKHHATIELNSWHTRGQVILDHLKTKLSNVIIIERINSDLFKEYILNVKCI